MPLYTCECRACQHTMDYIATVEKRAQTPECEACGSTDTYKVILDAPSIRPDLNDFSTENGGKGRFNKQLMTHVTSQKDAIKKAEARGWEVLDKD
jgi:putative FmdB family regulatory protein